MLQIPEYKNRLFGDVLKDIIFHNHMEESQFSAIIGMNYIMLSNFINHKKYPGVKSLRKITAVFPAEEKIPFIEHFAARETRAWCVEELRKKGIRHPYTYVLSGVDSPLFTAIDRASLETLELQGLLKYLTEQEKEFFKINIISYIVERNKAMQKTESQLRVKLSQSEHSHNR